MPIYEFECPSCGGREVVFVVDSEDKKKIENIICKKCNKKMKKVISVSNFHLKGKGWYKDGYGNGSSTKQDKKD